MAVLCPRCGEYSSILDEHCKKCGFSIKNYLENRKRFGNVEVQATDNGSSSVCVKEETTASDDKDKSDEIQENIMRLLSNVKIVPDENKVEENEKIESNVQSVLESALEETFQKNSAVKIVAKKVANDVIILPQNRVKVEIEASRDVAKKSKLQGTEAKESEKITDIESKVEEIKKEIVAERQATIEDVAAKVDKKVEQSIDKVEEKVEAKEVKAEEKKEQEDLAVEDLLADRILRTDKQAEEKIEDTDKQAEQKIAEADKQAQILSAEGKAQSMREIKKAEADGIRVLRDAEAAGIVAIREAKADEAVLKMKYYEALATVANGKATKIFIPNNLAGISSIASVAKESLTDIQEKE